MRRSWKEKTFWGGHYVSIKSLLDAGAHRIEAWGNKKEGWWPYLVSGTVGIPIGPYFGPDQGDTLRNLKQAAGRCYEIDPKSVKKGRNWA